jgi:tRNA(Ile)-lysidine synthase
MWLARPLINERRAWLRNYLGAEGAAWIEDPANSNTAFERVRVRAYLAELEAGGADVARLGLLAARIRPHVAALDRAAGAYLSAGAQFEGPAIFIDRAAWSAEQHLPHPVPEHVRRRALSALITAAAGALREPPADAIERLDARMQAGDFPGASLGGATIAVKGARLRIDRDWGALHGRADGAPGAQRLALTPHHLTVWDGRLELCVGETGWSVGPARGGVELQCAGKAEALAPLIVEKKARWLLRQRVAHLLGEHD